jgi:hypothetical protein
VRRGEIGTVFFQSGPVSVSSFLRPVDGAVPILDRGNLQKWGYMLYYHPLVFLSSIASSEPYRISDSSCARQGACSSIFIVS